MRHPTLRIAALGLALCAAGAATAASDSPVYARSGSPLYDRAYPGRTSEMPTFESMAAGSPIHSGGTTAADTSLALDVAAALAADPRLEGATITVSAHHGNVSLSGSARSAEQGSHAENIARRIAGVGAVSGAFSAQGG